MDQAGSSDGGLRTSWWLYATGTVAVLGALQGGTIATDRLIGAGPLSLAAELAAAGAALFLLFSRATAAAHDRDRAAAERAGRRRSA